TRTAPAEPAVIEPAPVAPAAEESKVAGLPIDRIESDPEPDEPAATETPNVSIPVETVSAPELPVAPKETGSAGEKPEQAKELTKEQAKLQPRDTRRRVAHRPRRTRAVSAVSAPQRPLNLFEALFGGQQSRNSQTPGTQQAAQSQYQAQYRQPASGAQSAQGQYQQPAHNYQLQAPTELHPMQRQHSY
ncbi:MAG: hypothetical protein WBL96_21890, partial [Pseudolabrys sp.]